MSAFRARIGVLVALAMVLTLLYVPANKAQAAGFDATIDSAANFNGTSTYMESTNSVIPLSGDFTVEAWIYYDGADSMREFLSQGNDLGGFWLGSLWGGIRLPGNAAAPTLKVNSWQHIAVTYSSNTGIAWLNGQKVAAIQGMQNPLSSTLRIGKQFADYGEYWSGKIDEVKIWDNDRTGMVTSDMNSYGSGMMGTGLIAYYDFNNPVANGDGTFTIPDMSGAPKLHPLTAYGFTAGDFADVAVSVPTGTDGRDLEVTFTRPYLTASGKWTVPSGFEKIQALVVGGGGGGGAWGGGGGGGGQVVETTQTVVTAGATYSVGVGMGGSGVAFWDESNYFRGVPRVGSGGLLSMFGNTVAYGGGKGGSYSGNWSAEVTMKPGVGANGGGGAASNESILAGAVADGWSTGGASNQAGGYAGGNGLVPNTGLITAGGGGGAGGAGQDANVDGRTAGNGGPGKLSAITGLKYGGGGGGSLVGTPAFTDAGVVGNGLDGGGNADAPTEVGDSVSRGFDGRANTGGGAGGAGGPGFYNSEGGDGGSGIVVVKLTAAAVTAQTTVYGCDGTATLNGLKVAAAHSKIFYIDSGDDQKMDANYLDYRVTSTTARSDLWVEVSGFTGGKVSLANPADSAQPLGTVTAGGTGAAYFLAKASEDTDKAQSHVVKVYDRKPGSGGAIPLYTCSFSFNSVAETIKAAANKVDSITTTTVSSLGTTFTITVLGDSGTIGAGNSTDGRMLWLSPASRSTWPTQALRLEDSQITTYSDSARTTVLKVFSNTLLLNTSTALPAASRQYYKAVYTFRVIGNAPAIASISPSAMISSGTQVKHVGFDSIPTGTGTKVDVVAPKEEVSVTSSASRNTEVRSDGTTRITYTVKVENKGSKDAEIDEIHDHGDDDEHYVEGSTKKDGKSEKDGEHDDHDEHDYTFSGPIKVPAKGSTTYEYKVEVKTCKKGEKYKYEHHSEGHEGGSDDDEDEDHDGHDDDGDGDHDGKDDHDDHSKHIGSTPSTDSHVEVSGNCGVPTAAVKVVNVVQPPAVQTGTAVSVGETSATVYGLVDPNATAGLSVKFTVGTSPSLLGGTDVTMPATTAVTNPYSINKALTNLTAGTRYYYRLTVTSPTGDVSGSIYHFDTQEAPGVPTATTAAVTSISNVDRGALFTGAITAARISGGSKALFEWASDGGNGACTGLGSISNSGNLKDGATDAVLNNGGATDMTFRATGLTASAKYCVRVVALHGAGYTTRVVGDWVSFTQAPKTAQSVAFNAQMPPLAAGGNTTVAATATSGLAVTYTSNDTAVCTVNASTGAVSAVADAGVCSITVSQVGNEAFYAAESKTLSFDIVPPVVLTESLERGKYRNAYSATTLEADGGNGSFSNWAVIGSLPAGLSLSSSGVLSGTPTAAGVYTFGVTVDSNGVTSKERLFTLVVDVAELTVTADDVSVTFGDAVPVVTSSVTGFLGADGEGDIALAPVCFTTYQSGDNVSNTTRVATCKDAWDENYAFTYEPGLVAIERFEIGLRAINKAKQNLSNSVRPDPALDFEIFPSLPGGEVLADALPTGVNLSRVAGETPGDYAINISPKSVGANYTVVNSPGVFTVQTPLIVPSLEATDFSVTFGETLGSALTAAAKDGATAVAGTYEYTYLDADANEFSLAQGDKLDAGIYTVKVKFTADDQQVYYPTVETTMTIEVKQKTVTITSDDLEKLVNELDPNLSYQTTGFVGADGEADLGSINVTRVAGETPGTYSVSTSGGSNPNYVVVHAASVLSISKIAVVLTDKGDGTNGRGYTISCEAAKRGSTVTVDIDGTTVGTITVSQNGTCPNTTMMIPDSFTSGPHVITADGIFPSGRTGLTNKSTAVLAEPVAAVLAPPGKPGVPAVTATDKSATLTWTAPTSGGAVASYVVASYPAGAVCKVVALSASCTGLSNGTAYTFTVTAVNASGTNESDPSVSVTPKALVVDDPNATVETEVKSARGTVGTFSFPGGSGFGIDKKGRVFVRVSSIYLVLISGKVSVTYKQGSATKVFTCTVKEYGTKKKMSKQPTKRMLYVDPKGCQLPTAAWSELKSNVISIKAVVSVKRYYATTGTTKSPKSPTVLKTVKRTMLLVVGAKG